MSRFGAHFVLKFRQKKDLPRLPTHSLLLRHPLLPSLRYIFHSDTKLYYVFDFIPAVPLLRFLDWRVSTATRKETGGKTALVRLSEPEFQRLAAQLVAALSYLQSRGFSYTCACSFLPWKYTSTQSLINLHSSYDLQRFQG